MIDEDMSELIGLIYEASMRPDLWSDVLQQVAAVTPCITATLFSHDVIARTSTLHQTYGVDPFYLQEYLDRWAATNPIAEAMATLEPGQVAGLETMMDYDSFKRHAFYLEWGRPQNYCDCICILLERTPTRVASISLVTNDAQGLATPETIARLRILAPHFLRAIRIGRVLEQAHVKEDTIAATLDALASAVLLLNAKGDIVHANAHALDLIATGPMLGQIKAASARLNVSGQATSKKPSVRTSTDGDHTFVVDTTQGERVVCHSLPLELAANANNRSALTLIVMQRSTSTETATKTVAARFGLTNRERDVLFCLVEIGGVIPTATILNLSTATIRSHLKSVFLKTQKHRQSDLVRLVADFMTPFHDRTA